VIGCHRAQFEPTHDGTRNASGLTQPLLGEASLVPQASDALASGAALSKEPGGGWSLRHPLTLAEP
jgi:hypothetical protein